MAEESQIQALIVRACKGDEACFGQIYELFSDRVFNFLIHKVKHKQTAEDLLHNVFLKAWKSLPNYKPQSNAKFSTWLFSIAQHTVIDHWRVNREVVDLDKVENLAQLAIEPHWFEDYSFLVRALDQLPADYQTVINLRFKQDLSVTETAQVMNRSEVGIRVLQHRAIKALKKLLDGKL